MENIVKVTDNRELATGSQEEGAAKIQKALSEILKSTPFRSSKQSQQLLQYIVDHSLAGHAELLKERIIGAEVFGRPLDYDTNEDPIVRGRAAEVRKRLAQYYMDEGQVYSIRIEVSPGSYHASFSESSKSLAREPGMPELPSVHASLPAPEPDPVPLAPLTSSSSAGRANLNSKKWWFLGFAAFMALAASVAYIDRPLGPVQQFWSPLLETSKPVLIYTGANAVYMPSPDLIQRYRATHHLGDLDKLGREFLPPLTQDQKFGPGDLLEMNSSFVTLGDVAANVNVASLLTRFNRSFDLRSGEDVAFGDLRLSPAVLIGAFNNGWTLQMTGDLPYVFEVDHTIKDRVSDTRPWRPVSSLDGKVLVDFALVARLPHSKTGEPLIAIAGVTQCGTQAAAEFITSAQALADLLKSAPKDWASKNMEFVLQTKVVNDIPTSPAVVAIRYW